MAEPTKLELDFVAPFKNKRQPGSPRLDPMQTGIAIHAHGVQLEEGTLRCEVMLTYCFPMPVWDAYHYLEWAISLRFEDSHSGRAASKQLIDGGRRYPRLDGPNYKGPPEPHPMPSLETGYVAVEVACEVPAEAPPGAHLYVTALFRDELSNTLAIDPVQGTVTSN